MHQRDNTNSQIDNRQTSLDCPHDETILLDYITGLASAKLRSEIERTPSSIAEAKSLAQEIGPWMPYLHRLACPDTEQLVNCQEKRLSGTERLVIKRHIDLCPLCREELQILQDMDDVPISLPMNPLREWVEALLQPSLIPAIGQAVRGDIQCYRTPDLLIHINTRKGHGQPRSWTLRGQMRDEDGLPFIDVESVELQSLEPNEEPSTYPCTLDAKGAFVFRELPSGQYRLTVITPDSEISIRQLGIGN